MGYIRGFVHGAVAGTIAGICIAPQTGAKTREQLSAFGRAARDGYGVAEKTFQQIAPLVSGATSFMRQKAQEQREAVTVEGNIRIHEDNGHSR